MREIIRRLFLFILAGIIPALPLHAQQADDRFRRAADLYASGRAAEAVPILQEILRRDPRQADAALFLSQIHYENQDLEASAKVLADALRNPRADARLHAALGSVRLAQTRYVEAVASLRRALKKMPGDPRVKELLGNALENLGIREHQAGRAEEAAAHLAEAAAVDGRNVSARKNLALIRASQGRYAEAERELASALPYAEKDAALLELLLRIRLNLRSFEKAEATAQQLCRLTPAAPGFCLEYAYLLRFNGRWEEARGTYARLVERFPADRRVARAFAEMYTARGEDDSAVAVLLAFSRRVPEERAIYADVARSFAGRGLCEEARMYYRQAMSGGQGDGALFVRIAELYEEEGKYPEAAALLREGEQRFPNDAGIARALSLLSERHFPEQAPALYETLRARFAQDPWFDARLGEWFFRLDSLDSAERYFRSAIGKGSADPLPWLRLASTLRTRGDTAEARRNARMGIRLAFEQLQQIESRLLSSTPREGFGEGSGDADSLETIAREREAVEKLLRTGLEETITAEPPERIEELLSSLPENQAGSVIAREYRAECLVRSGRSEQALDEFSAILKNDAKNKRAHAGIARILETEGRQADALLAWKRVQSIDPRDTLSYAPLVRLARAAGKIPELAEDWRAQAQSRQPSLPLLLALRDLAAAEGMEDLRKKTEEMIRRTRGER